MQRYVYAVADPANASDPTGKQTLAEQFAVTAVLSELVDVLGAGSIELKGSAPYSRAAAKTAWVALNDAFERTIRDYEQNKRGKFPRKDPKYWLVEYGGLICREKRTGNCVATGPATSTRPAWAGGSRVMDPEKTAPCPQGPNWEKLGGYHSHPEGDSFNDFDRAYMKKHGWRASWLARIDVDEFEGHGVWMWEYMTSNCCRASLVAA